jgi:pSer/pThr/pTyr-binding forkhead associated (FHA) protein
MPRALKVSGGQEKTTIETNLQRRDSVVIGRGADCDVVIQDLKASRRHCQLTRNESGFMLEDLGSRNGTYVNGEKITAPVLLKAKHTFQIGDTMFYLG